MNNSELEKNRRLDNISDLRPEATPEKRRPRAMTTLKLQWLAERLRKAEGIKQAIANGSYAVDSRLVARAVLGLMPATDEPLE